MTIVFLLLALEVAILAAVSILYYRVVSGKATKDPLVFAKLFVAFWQAMSFAAVGLVFSLVGLIVSLFLAGAQANLVRDLSVMPFFVMGWVGIFYGAWRYIALKPPPSESDYELAEKAAEVSADGITGWPRKPAFTYRGEASNLIVMSVLWPALSIFLTLNGAATLFVHWFPGLLPAAIQATLLRSATDGPVTDGFLLFGLGIVVLVGGGLLLSSAWQKLQKQRPLSINERGIYAFYRGKPWRFIPWGEVTSITKHRAPEDRPLQRKIGIQIDGAGVTLLVTPTISDFSRACRLLSRFARQHSIKLLLVDKGKDTLAAQRKVLAPADYKQLARVGVITDIAEL